MRSHLIRLLRATLATLALFLAASTLARADGTAPPAPAAPVQAAKGDGDWVPMTTQMIQPGESFEAKNLVAVAYGFIWVMVAGFVLTVWRRADRLEKEIEALRAQVKAHAQKSGGAASR